MLVRNSLWVRGALLAALLLAGCGVEIGNPKKPKGDPSAPGTASLIDDASIASGIASSQADQVVATAAEEAKLNPLGLASSALALVGPPQHDGGGNANGNGGGNDNDDQQPLRSPLAIDQDDALGGTTTATCTANAASTVVLVTSTGSLTHGFGAGQHSQYVAKSRNETTTSTWTSKTSLPPCTADLTSVNVDWTKADGLSLVTQVDQTMSNEVTRNGERGTFSRNVAFTLTGTRSATRAVPAAATGAASLAETKTVTSNFDETLTASRQDGTALTLDTTIQTKDGAPIVLSITRDPTTQAWQTKTVVSGVLVTEGSGNARLEAAYTNLLFTIAGGCVPVSGSITGSFYTGTDTTPRRTYTVAFDQGVGTITFDDGTTSSYVPSYCDLDDGSTAAAILSPDGG